MDLKRLRYFCTVAEQRSITRASEVLHIAQPALSKRLHELEEELGTELLVRNGREMKLTDAGAFLYQRACLILRSVEDVRRDTLDFAHHARRVLKIGISYLYEKYFTPILLKLQQDYPDLELRVSVSDSSHLEFLLNQRIVDVIFAQAPYTIEGYHITHLPPIKLCAVVANDLLTEKDKPLSLVDIAALPLIMLHRIGGTGLFEYLTDQIRKLGIHPNILMHVSQPQMVIDLLESGLQAATLLPESEVNSQNLKRCTLISLNSQLSVFHPAIVQLSTGVIHQEIDDVVKSIM